MGVKLRGTAFAGFLELARYVPAVYESNLLDLNMLASVVIRRYA
jgi:hypothetical protein